MSAIKTPRVSPHSGWLRPRPTLVVPLPELPEVAQPTVSTVHLSEGRTGWTLTLALTPELLDRLVHSAPGAVDGLSCTVHVEPNLLPGEPFVVDRIEIANRPEAPVASAG